MIRTLALCLAILAIASACNPFADDPEADLRRELRRNAALWSQAPNDDYDFVQRRFCFCGFPGEPVLVRVRDGAVVARLHAESGEPIDDAFGGRFEPPGPPPGFFDSAFPPVEGLFQLVEGAIGSDRLEVEYHVRFGYPTRISVDRDFRIADDELTVIVDSLDFVR